MCRTPHPEHDSRNQGENQDDVDPRVTELSERECRSAQRVTSAEAEEHSPDQQIRGRGAESRPDHGCDRVLPNGQLQQHGQKAGSGPDDHRRGQRAIGIRTGKRSDTRQRPREHAEEQSVTDGDREGENRPTLLGRHD